LVDVSIGILPCNTFVVNALAFFRAAKRNCKLYVRGFGVDQCANQCGEGATLTCPKLPRSYSKFRPPHNLDLTNWRPGTPWAMKTINNAI
jgi:hypothetical protein